MTVETSTRPLSKRAKARKGEKPIPLSTHISVKARAQLDVIIAYLKTEGKVSESDTIESAIEYWFNALSITGQIPT